VLTPASRNITEPEPNAWPLRAPPPPLPPVTLVEAGVVEDQRAAIADEHGAAECRATAATACASIQSSISAA